MGILSASETADLYDRIERLERLLRLQATPPLEIIESYNPILRLNQPRRLIARITGLVVSGGGSGSGSGGSGSAGPDYCKPQYTWVPTAYAEACIEENPADTQGTGALPALCLNSREDVPGDDTEGDGNGALVELIQAAGWPYYVFFYDGISAGEGGGSGSGGGVRSLPVTQCVGGVTVVKMLRAFDQNGRPISFTVS